MCGRLCLCLSASLRSYVTETRRCRRHFIAIEMSPFTRLSSSSICSKWEMRMCIAYQSFLIHIQILSFICWKAALCLRGLSCWSSPFFICTTTCIREFESQYWLCFFSVFLVCVCVCVLTVLGIGISFLNFHIVLFSVCTVNNLPASPSLSHSNLTCTLAYMPHAYSYSHPHIQSM